MNILSKLLAKRNIKDISELDGEERKTYEIWQEVLNKEEMNVEDIKNFCKSQIGVIEGKFANYEIDAYKKSELVPYFVAWNLLLKAIEGPKSQKVALENHLEQLLKQN